MESSNGGARGGSRDDRASPGPSPELRDGSPGSMAHSGSWPGAAVPLLPPAAGSPAIRCLPGLRRLVPLLVGLLVAVPALAGLTACAPAPAGAHGRRIPPAPPETPAVPVLAGGIQVNEPDHGIWVESVRAAGLNAVQVTVYARQLAWDSAEMILPEEAPAVVAEIRAAHAAGLDVVLVLRTALEHGMARNRHLWHGMIWPDRAEVDAWFERYGEFALWGARLAAREDVDLLAVASELNSLTSTVEVEELPDLYAYFLDPRRTTPVRQRLVECAESVPPGALEPDLAFRDGTRYPDLDAYLLAEEETNREWTRRVVGLADDAGTETKADLELLNRRRRAYERRWRRLIRRVRQVYSGPLTYAANFDQVQQVGFWDALDAIGVNAYYGLGLWGLEGEALEEKLEESWRRVAGELGALAQRAGREAGIGSHHLPVVIAELGWTAKAGATVRPYSYHRVEVLETVGRRPDGGVPLSCVHWATQPEAPGERVRALRALLEVVREGDFPALRGFLLWKLTTLPSQREIEPFAVVLPGPRASLPAVPPHLSRGLDRDRADALFLRVAAELAGLLQRQVRDGTLGGEAGPAGPLPYRLFSEE